MKALGRIRRQLASGEFEFSRHAFKRAVERNISEVETRRRARAMVIEDYPDDKYSPSCLLLGFTETEPPLHSQVSYADTGLARIILSMNPMKPNGAITRTGGENVSLSRLRLRRSL